MEVLWDAKLALLLLTYEVLLDPTDASMTASAESNNASRIKLGSHMTGFCSAGYVIFHALCIV